MPSHKEISPPLPLPLHFTLLPSLLPSKSLVPLLYSEVNGLPIYLTLSPSHEPHLSLLPLLLALFPTSPLHIIKRLPLDSISLDLSGNAPFVDIWVPLPLARGLCKQLGVIHLFRDTASGILSDVMDQALSWEDDASFCHNWMPSAISPSAYSLDKLLSTPFRHIDLIPDERCIATNMGAARRAALLEVGDLSRIRRGAWKQAWEDCLTWTVTAWAEYSKHPSRPPSKHSSPLALRAHRLLRDLTMMSSSHSLDYPISPADIATSFDPISEPTVMELVFQIIRRLAGLLTSASNGGRKQLERRARIQIGVVEIVGFQLVDAFVRRGVGVGQLGQEEVEGKSRLRHISPTTKMLATANPTPIESASTYPLSTAIEMHYTRRRAEGAESLAIPALELGALHGESVDGWQWYLFIAGVIAIAIFLGLYPT